MARRFKRRMDAEHFTVERIAQSVLVVDVRTAQGVTAGPASEEANGSRWSVGQQPAGGTGADPDPGA